MPSNKRSERSTLPTWVHGFEPTARRHRPLMNDTQADVAVVGAGIAGLTTAFLLRREGFHVIVLDDGPIGGGETERTTAHLASALDDRYFELERMHGAEGARLAAESHNEAIALIEAVIDQLGVDCDFTRLDGWLFNPPGVSTGSGGGAGSSEVLQRELEAARRAGLTVEMFNRVPDLAFDTGTALRFARQAQIHPMKYLRALVNAFVEDGGAIYTGTHVALIEGGQTARIVTSEGHVVSASSVVVATNTPVNDRVAVHTKQSAWRTYVVAMALPRRAMPNVLLWDTADPYHYVRTQRALGAEAFDTLIVGGEDHRTGEDVDHAARWASLEAWARERFPVTETLARWSGQIMEPVDGLAYIGRDPAGAENVFIATGDSGHGMTHGTIAGMLLTDLIGGVDHPWAKLYDPRRKPTGALTTWTAENLKNAAHYADYVLPTPRNQPTRVEDIPRGGGAVIRKGLVPIAVSCDEAGVRTSCSAVCPHLGGMVVWNDAEQSFDCPVHGSRFDAHGHVINGPANADLQPVDDPAEERLPLVVGNEPLKEV